MDKVATQGWALVTGASDGLGRAIAQELAHVGYDVLLVARRVERLQEVASAITAETGRDVRAIPVDLVSQDVVDTLDTGLTAQGFSPADLTLVVNNAGSGSFGPFQDENPEAMRSDVALNIGAPLSIIRWIVPHFVARGGGTICNIASVAAFTPGPYMATYYAAKAWALSLGESLSEELKVHGVRVVTCCPGPFQSGFHKKAGIDPNRIGRVPSAEEVARGVISAIRRGAPVAPIGVFSRIWAILGPRLPRRWSRRIIGALQQRRRIDYNTNNFPKRRK